MLQNIRASDSADILAPLFGKGHMTLKSGSVAHIIECTAVDVQIDLQYKKCAEDIPVLKPVGNESAIPFFMHPISRILTPTSADLPCSAKFPQIFRLDDGHHVCNTGAGMTRCLTPTILQPNSNNMPISEWVDFSRAMSIGILSKPEINILSLKIHHHAYINHMQAKQLWENYKHGNVGPHSDMGFTLDDIQLSAIKSAIAAQVMPLFMVFGEAYVIVFGVFLSIMTVSYCIGTCRRLYAEYRLAGCGPWLLLALLGNLWNVFRLPLTMIKGAAKAAENQGATGSSSDTDNIVLATEMNHFRQRLCKVEAHNGHQHNNSPVKGLYTMLDDKDNTSNPSIDGTNHLNEVLADSISHRPAAPMRVNDVMFNNT